MWSERSVQSRYVRDEATYALERSKLVPVAIENVKLPFRFRGVHTPSLLGWDGSKDFSEFRKLVEDISTILRRSHTRATVAKREQHLGGAEESRKVDEERLRKQGRQRAEEAAKLKADDETRRRIDEEKSRAQQEAARAQQAKPTKTTRPRRSYYTASRLARSFS